MRQNMPNHDPQVSLEIAQELQAGASVGVEVAQGAVTPWLADPQRALYIGERVVFSTDDHPEAIKPVAGGISAVGRVTLLEGQAVNQVRRAQVVVKQPGRVTGFIRKHLLQEPEMYGIDIIAGART